MGRIIAKANATPPPALTEVVDAPPPFPAPELPAGERWPVRMFTRHTGIHLDGDSARWLAAWGRCYESDGLEDDLADLIRISAGAVVDPWRYLATCIVNGRDAWTVSAQLLGKILTAAGQHSLESALTNIGAGHVARRCHTSGRAKPTATIPPHAPIARSVWPWRWRGGGRRSS